MMDEQLMSDQEKALLAGFGSYIHAVLPQATKSTAEVIWTEGESKWKVSWTLSVGKSHSANVRILHRMALPGIDEPVIVLHQGVNYKAVIGAPRVFFNGIVVGSVIDAAIPAGFLLIDDKPVWLDPVPQSGEERGVSPFAIALSMALSEGGCLLRKSFSQLSVSHEYKALNMKFPRYMLAVPVLGKTIVAVSSCASPSKSMNIDVPLGGRLQKHELAFADPKKLGGSLEVYSELSRMARHHSVEYAANSNTLPIVNARLLIPMLLMLDAVRMREQPETPALTLRELIGEAPPDRMEGLIKRYSEILAGK